MMRLRRASVIATLVLLAWAETANAMPQYSLPALGNVLSTGALQPLAPHQWPAWARRTPDFAAAWFTPLDAPLNTSTGELAISRAQASVDMERIEPGSETPFVYYCYFYCQMTDGRTFQYGPVKDLEYERHRVEHPPWLASYKSTAT
jgi:hypothetical protein